MKYILIVYVAMALMWLQYLAVMNLDGNKKRLTFIAKLWAYPILLAGLLSDVVFNVVLGSLMYLEIPREWLFTTRCERHLHADTWRGCLARWFCRNFLDPFDPDGGHCS